jgi:orotate phosphoribosyltransferase
MCHLPCSRISLNGLRDRLVTEVDVLCLRCESIWKELRKALRMNVLSSSRRRIVNGLERWRSIQESNRGSPDLNKRFAENLEPRSSPLQSKPMITQTHAQQLLSVLARLSFRLGQFKLSSGGTSDYYVDCRTTTLNAEGGRLTGHAVLELLEVHHIHAEAVGGLTMGADPIVSNVATASAWRAISNPGAPLLQGFLVRKAEKTHGTGRRIEGFCREGARVVIVDDVCTTGASTINAIEAAREAGMSVAAVVCIVEREEAGGRPAVEAAAGQAPFLRLYSANEVRAEHVRQLEQ